MAATWVMDTYHSRNNELLWNVESIFKELKVPVYIADYVPFAENQDYGPYEDGDNVILYGTINFVKKCKKRFSPGAFGFNSNRQCNVYMTQIPNSWFLNSDYVILPFGDLVNKKEQIYQMFDTNEIFMRPLAGDKSFTGKAVSWLDFPHEIDNSKKLEAMGSEELILIATSKRHDIKGEFRFIVGAGEVIAGSEYRWDGKLDLRRDWPMECETMAHRVAKLPWQLDTVYTCDVALMANGTPKIVELNSFASAGWYACDAKKIISRVTEIAEAEHEGKL